MTIYDITNDYLNIQNMMNDPELDPQLLADTMDAIEGNIECKAESYGMIIKNLESEISELEAVIESLNEEIKRIKTKKSALENNIKSMKERLKTAMELTGKTKIKTKLFSFSVGRTTPSVVLDCDNPDEFPDEFIRTKKEINKKALLDAMKASELNDILGLAHLEEGTKLTIR